MISRRSQAITLILSGAALFFCSLLALSLGAVSTPISDVVHFCVIAISDSLLSAQQHYPSLYAIVFQIRLPRVVAAIVAGGALAIAGVCTQGLFRNPLASPDILGVSAGSSFGAVVAISFGFALTSPLATPFAAAIGALICAFFVYLLAKKSHDGQTLYLILAGLALSSLLGGMTMGILLFAKQYQLNQFVFWTMGGLEGRMWQHVLWPLPIILIVAGLALSKAHWLNLLSLGNEAAHGLGLNVPRARVTLLMIATLLTAMSIAIAGPIGFIGLMVPHLVRLLFGANHKTLLPISAMFGAILLLVCDLAGRYLIAPYEIKAGIIISVVGGLYFVMLIVRVQQKGRLI
ncbi:FecCD family ABC transporter permease [Vibrio gallicus]|uniref:FecCD family ABC transporter permease n=1 Tax=Vibrio gallicus TaxID=190897 RepID=UPI0021C2D44F|nr:iron ABC transporter permease [Vibrio gallicus]